MADYLADTIHMAVVGDDVIVLDVAQDSYSCLVGVASSVHFGRDGQVMIDDDAALAALREAGFLSFEPTGVRGMPPALPTVAGAAASQIRPRVRECLRFLCTTLTMFQRYDQIGFSDLITPAQTVSPAPLATSTSDSALRSAALFSLWLPWVPGQGACLYRAFMLRQFMLRAGLHADWVFGVATWPFSAHCWLQVGDVLLDDDVDRVRSYTPIMVV